MGEKQQGMQGDRGNAEESNMILHSDYDNGLRRGLFIGLIVGIFAGALIGLLVISNRYNEKLDEMWGKVHTLQMTGSVDIRVDDKWNFRDGMVLYIDGERADQVVPNKLRVAKNRIEQEIDYRKWKRKW